MSSEFKLQTTTFSYVCMLEILLLLLLNHVKNSF